MADYTVTFNDTQEAMIAAYLAANVQGGMGTPVTPTIQEFVDSAVAVAMVSVQAWNDRQPSVP